MHALPSPLCPVLPKESGIPNGQGRPMQNPAMRRILELGQRSGSAVMDLSPHKGFRAGAPGGGA